jgi:DNA-binding beta-propeller fold protein YncE
MSRNSRLVGVLLMACAFALALAVSAAGAGSQGKSNGKGQALERVFTLQPTPAGNPEGIAYQSSRRAFFVSITADGAIYRGTLGSDTVAPFIPGAAGKSGVGIKVRGNRLYVAGGMTGTITVYDLSTRQAIATFQTGAGGFLNDLVVTRDGDVWVTDSFRPTLWHVTGEQVRAGSGTPQPIDLSTAFGTTPGEFHANGIVALNSHRFVVVDTTTGTLQRIDVSHGAATIRAITGVTLPGGDGMILDRGRLVVVQGGPPAQLSFVKLTRSGSQGSLLETRTSTNLAGPSTVARARKLYLVVNADFALSKSPPFTIAGLPR